MRVDSIVAINATDQHTQRTQQYDNALNEKNVTGNSFEEYLRAKLQQTSNPIPVRNVENQIAGLLMGHFSNLRLLNKNEPKPEGNVG